MVAHCLCVVLAIYLFSHFWGIGAQDSGPYRVILESIRDCTDKGTGEMSITSSSRTDESGKMYHTGDLNMPYGLKDNNFKQPAPNDALYDSLVCTRLGTRRQYPMGSPVPSVIPDIQGHSALVGPNMSRQRTCHTASPTPSNAIPPLPTVINSLLLCDAAILAAMRENRRKTAWQRCRYRSVPLDMNGRNRDTKIYNRESAEGDASIWKGGEWKPIGLVWKLGFPKACSSIKSMVPTWFDILKAAGVENLGCMIPQGKYHFVDYHVGSMDKVNSLKYGKYRIRLSFTRQGKKIGCISYFAQAVPK
ncbi:hypothetical protein J6590_043034 [Homalodisca vitripennis]|nr:hypothetical protein J6590_043034 [Homalodisca vitripennis]